jgi:hypothetical protein
VRSGSDRARISKPIPASPARKSSEIRFGSSKVERKRVTNPGLVFTISAFAVCSVCPIGTVVRPSTCFSRAGRLGEIRSATFICTASTAVRLDATRTALSAQAALR